MQRFKLSILTFQIITLTATILPDSARSQSGRGRPKVATPGAAAASPEPANVPAAAAVVKQEQVGNTWRFALYSSSIKTSLSYGQKLSPRGRSTVGLIKFDSI